MKYKTITPLLFLLIYFGSIFFCSEKNNNPVLDEAIIWLEAEAHRIIRGSVRIMGDGTKAFPPQMGIGYEAFWLRDYELTLEGCIDAYSDEELIASCMVFINGMHKDGAGVDCIKFDGTPIYRPAFGGNGKYPVSDGSQFTVAVAWHTFQRTKNNELLNTVLDPLIKSMNYVQRNPETRLVHIKQGEEWERAPYGFTDGIRKQGDLLFCSLLYIQACRQLSDLLIAGGRKDEAQHWVEEGELVAKSIRKTFWDPRVGLFCAATIQCREHDIWGSAFSVYLSVANEEQALSIASYFQKHYSEIVLHGQIRQLPGGVYWEKKRVPGTYQNGGFWGTATGWFVYTIDLVDPSLADKTILDMVNHYKEHGACEWINVERVKRPHYLAGAANPLAGIGAMLERRRSQ